jgi:hypothetical protein
LCLLLLLLLACVGGSLLSCLRCCNAILLLGQ